MLKLLGSSYASGIERLRYQRHFSDSRSATELALHGANDGLWDFDLDEERTYFSPRWKAMLGYGDDEVEPLNDWQQLVHPEDLPRVHAALRDHLARQGAAVRKRASTEAPRWRVALGRQPRQGARG